MSDQPDRRTYTAEEFDRLRKWFADNWIEDDDNYTIADAALRMAANAMRPGVIEDALRHEAMDDYHASMEHVRPTAAAIRAALTEDAPQP